MKRDLIMGLSFGVLVTLGVALRAYTEPKPSEPQLYTVHFDGIDYQDLSRHWLDRGGSAYRTKSGKRIEFRGNFYEVEQ